MVFNPDDAFNDLVSNDYSRFKKAMNSNVTRHFKLKEFFIYRTRSEIQKYLTIDTVRNILALALELQKLRDRLWKPIKITSGWRDPVTNERVGGARASQHLIGKAADITVTGSTPKKIQEWLDPFWHGGLGYGYTFTHLDIRPYRARFGYG